MLGYGTQKPEALLERILKASSSEGDLVLDPFCGCGTTVQVAQRLNRRWIGIDITHLAIGLIKKRLSDAFGPEIKSTYDVIGEPTDLAGAGQLAAEDKYQFQWWALGQVGARPAEQKKGADRGIDGRLYFHDDESGQSSRSSFRSRRAASPFRRSAISSAFSPARKPRSASFSASRNRPNPCSEKLPRLAFTGQPTALHTPAYKSSPFSRFLTASSQNTLSTAAMPPSKKLRAAAPPQPKTCPCLFSHPSRTAFLVRAILSNFTRCQIADSHIEERFCTAESASRNLYFGVTDKRPIFPAGSPEA